MFTVQGGTNVLSVSATSGNTTVVNGGGVSVTPSSSSTVSSRTVSFTSSSADGFSVISLVLVDSVGVQATNQFTVNVFIPPSIDPVIIAVAETILTNTGSFNTNAISLNINFIPLCHGIVS